jgi:hypothetical protein
VKIGRSVWRVFLASIFVATFASVLVGQTATSGGYVIGTDGKRVETTTTFEGQPTSYKGHRTDHYSVGYYVKDGAMVCKNSLLGDSDKPVSELDLNLKAVGEGFDAVLATGKETNLTLTGSINASDDGDGSKASDFTGLGTQVLVTDYAKVKLDSMKIETKGFARAAFIADNHAQIFVKNSSITVLGANPLTQTYKGYRNSADQDKMISPPWVLGIQGGARGANMIGDKPTLTVVGSEVSSGGWAILSTDSGSDFVMNVVDSHLSILPPSQGGMTAGKFSYADKYGSGYGTYVIGNAREYFYGATFSGTTYAGIFTGGDAYYQSSKGTIELKDAEGNPIQPIPGQGKPTIINSVFGFMNHGPANVNVLDGTIVNAEDAVFLSKSSGAIFLADNAVLNSASGILLQMIDNDDRTVGMGANGFNTEFKEAAGWPSENGNITSKSIASTANKGGMPGAPGVMLVGMPGAPGGPGGPGAPVGPGGPPGMDGPAGYKGVKLDLKNGNYTGNVFNGSGYYKQAGNALDVQIEKGATLAGAISLTETRHVNEEGKQNTDFTIDQYYYLGHVANRNYRNQTATVSVNLTEGGKWIVTGESLLNKLSVCCSVDAITGANGAKVVMKIDGKETAIKTGKVYSGNIAISLAK